MSRYVPPANVSDAQLCAALLAENAADAMRGDWDALCWIASSRCDLVCEALGRDADSDRIKVVRAFVARPTAEEVETQANEALTYIALYRRVKSVREVAAMTGVSKSEVHRKLKESGELAPWGCRDGRRAAA